MSRSKIIIFFFFIIIAPYFISCNTIHERSVSEDQRELALDILISNLHNENLWEKVHAAEFLLDLGYKNEVYEIFINGETQKRDSLYQRIGVWRVLAQASQNQQEKQRWVDSLSNVYKKPNAADHIHATESLAKLGISTYNVSPELTDSILNGEHNSLWLYTLWGAAFTNNNKGDLVKEQLLNNIVNKDESDDIRRLSAYALHNVKDLDINEWSLLMSLACQESDSTMAYVNILSSALANTPIDSLELEKVSHCKEKVIESIFKHNAIGRRDALSAISEVGNEDDLHFLLPLASKNDYNFNDSDDVAMAAAYSILRIDRKQKYTLHSIDWGVIGLYAICMILIGWYFSRRVKNTEDYLLGGRKMNSFAVGLSLFITMISSLSFLSYPGEMVKYGPAVFIGMLIFPLVYYLVGWFLIPKFMEMKITSAYELLEIRFGLNVRLLATFFFLTLRFFWMATIIYATVNTALITVVDISPSNSTYIGILLMLVTMLYTTIGGYKAVIATDAIQSVILWVATILAIVFVMKEFNSFTAWLPSDYLVSHWESIKWGVNVTDRSTVGNTMIYLLTWYICTNGSDQMTVQRYLSTKNLKEARKSFGVSLIVTFIVKISLAVVGLAMISYFAKNPHFLDYGQTLSEQADNLLPKFILVGLPIGVSGLVVAGILAAAMSSISSGLNSSSSVINEDILKRVMPRFVSSNPLQQVKIISVIVGIIAILLSLLVGNVQGNLLDVVIKVVNLFVAPLFVLFFMAIFIPFATSKGTIIGGVFSVGIAVSIAFWRFLGIEVFWIMPISLIAGIGVGIIISYIELSLKKRVN